jgi:UDP-3-O-[3-hydroxymyristoyl] N-acetylglucosamine deacetylase
LKKKTIQKAIEFEGVGVHSGRNIHLILNPSESGRIEFVRRDKGEKWIELDPNKTEADFCTILTDGETKVQTIEHLMAVLHVFELDSLVIELWGEEIPIMDGSAFPFAKAIQEAGICYRKKEG